MSIRLEMQILAFQAESVAFLVCSKYGIDTSEYSFGYIAGWSSDKDTKELKSSLDTISKCADEITRSIDKELGVKSLDQIVKRKERVMER